MSDDLHYDLYNITNIELISEPEKDHSMIETRGLKNVIFFQAKCSNALWSWKSVILIRNIFIKPR